MPAGIVTTVDEDGYATVDFVDTALRGPALNRLIEIGGPETIETITRRGPRRLYKVPEGNAREAGLLDVAASEVPPPAWSAGSDTGAAAALSEADPNVYPGEDGADWHTPVAANSSANSFVGTVPNADVLDRPQVVTGDGSSSGGSGAARPHTDVISQVAGQRSPFQIQTDGIPSRVAPDPRPAGSVPRPDGVPDGEPNEDWKRYELDAYAVWKGIDTTGLPNKSAVLDKLTNPAE